MTTMEYYGDKGSKKEKQVDTPFGPGEIAPERR